MTIYPTSSPYASTPQIGGKISNFVYRPIPPAADDKTLTLPTKYKSRPDLLSFDLYGSSMYWWVFAVRNRNIINDPIWDMIPGMIIQIPSAATLKKVLG